MRRFHGCFPLEQRGKSTPIPKAARMSTNIGICGLETDEPEVLRSGCRHGNGAKTPVLSEPPPRRRGSDMRALLYDYGTIAEIWLEYALSTLLESTEVTT